MLQCGFNDADHLLRHIAESERFVRATLDCLSANIAILDEHGTILETNASWKAFAVANGLKIDRWVGVNYLNACDAATGPDQAMARAAAAGIRAVAREERELFTLEYPCHSPDEQRWFVLRATRFAGEGPVRLVVAHENITERELARRQQTELAHLARVASVGEMTSQLAHELSQPLAAILNYVQVATFLLDRVKPDNAGFLEAMDGVGNEARRASEIVRRFRNYVRKEEAQRRPENPNELVSEAIELMRPELHRHGIEMVLELAENPPQVAVDGVQIQQVLVNLIQNALDAMAEVPAGRRRLVVSSATEERWVRMTVADSGCGIPPDKLGRIFQPFFSSKRNGLGLGLSISRSIIESHGGRLSAASDGRSGACFEVRLPTA